MISCDELFEEEAVGDGEGGIPVFVGDRVSVGLAIGVGDGLSWYVLGSGAWEFEAAKIGRKFTVPKLKSFLES